MTKFTVTGTTWYVDGFDEEVEAHNEDEARAIAKSRQDERAEELRLEGLSLQEVCIETVEQEPIEAPAASGWTRATLSKLGDSELLGIISGTNPEGRYGQEWQWAMDEVIDRLRHAKSSLAALQGLLDWGREHTSPRDANSPHDLLTAAADALNKTGG